MGNVFGGIGEAIGSGVAGLLNGLIKPLTEPGPPVPCKDGYIPSSTKERDKGGDTVTYWCEVPKNPGQGWTDVSSSSTTEYRKPTSIKPYEIIPQALCPAGTVASGGLCAEVCPDDYTTVLPDENATDPEFLNTRCRRSANRTSRWERIGVRSSQDPAVATQPVAGMNMDDGDYLYIPEALPENYPLSPEDWVGAPQRFTLDNPKLPRFIKNLPPPPNGIWTRLTRASIPARLVQPLPHVPDRTYTIRDSQGRLSNPCGPGFKSDRGICVADVGCPVLWVPGTEPNVCRLDATRYQPARRASLIQKLILLVLSIVLTVFVARRLVRAPAPR